jgi:hypothetical protein
MVPRLIDGNCGHRGCQMIMLLVCVIMVAQRVMLEVLNSRVVCAWISSSTNGTSPPYRLPACLGSGNCRRHGESQETLGCSDCLGEIGRVRAGLCNRYHYMLDDDSL